MKAVGVDTDRKRAPIVVIRQRAHAQAEEALAGGHLLASNLAREWRLALLRWHGLSRVGVDEARCKVGVEARNRRAVHVDEDDLHVELAERAHETLLSVDGPMRRNRDHELRKLLADEAVDPAVHRYAPHFNRLRRERILACDLVNYCAAAATV